MILRTDFHNYPRTHDRFFMSVKILFKLFLPINGLSSYAFEMRYKIPIAQLVASLIADIGNMGLIPARSHTFIEMKHEIFYTVILLLPLIQVTSDVCIEYIWESPAQFENRIKPLVYIRQITHSTMYEKAPFC